MELPNLYSNKVLLYDIEAKEILYDLDGDKVSNIASLTKIMTTITAIENIDNLDEKVVIDSLVLREIPWDASVAGLKLNDEVTYRDLLYASILPSGADATTALAHNIAGSTKGFVELMNEEAVKIGLENTHFANVTGYDIDNHYSTTHDVLKLLLYSLDNPLFKEIYCTRDYTLTNGLEVKSTIAGYNRFLNADLSSILGSKTGYTGKSGMCMSAIIKTGGKELILITLGAPYSFTFPYNLKDTMTILDYLDEHYNDEELIQEGTDALAIPVVGSKEEEYVIKVPNSVHKYTEIGFDKDDVTVSYEGLKEISYKNAKGSKLGELKFFFKGELIDTQEVYLNESMHFSLYKFIKAHIIEIAFIILLLLAIRVFVIKRRKRRKRSHRVRRKVRR